MYVIGQRNAPNICAVAIVVIRLQVRISPDIIIKLSFKINYQVLLRN